MTELVMATRGAGGERVNCGGGGGGGGEQRQVSMVAVLMSAIRKSLVSCHIEEREEAVSMKRCTDNITTSTSLLGHLEMDIGWPTNVKHIAHVTFDRFNGFLGLRVEFEVDVPCRVPSASASVFGVSPESMQCSFDSKGNSVPTILLLMQERLYSQEGLKV